MNNNSELRLAAPIIAAVTLVGIAIAVFVMASDAFFLVFLAILFAVFLAFAARYCQQRLPGSYHLHLGWIVLALLAATAAGGYLFGKAIQQQLAQTSQQMDRSVAELNRWLEEHPQWRQAAHSIPFTEDFWGQQPSSEDSPAEDTPAEDTPAEDTPAEDTPAEDTPADDTPADDTPADDTPADDTPADDRPAEDSPAEDTPADDRQGSGSESAASAAEKPASSWSQQQWSQLMQRSLAAAGNALPAVGRVFSSTLGTLTGIAVIVFVSIFLAADPQLYYRGAVGLFPRSVQPRVRDILGRMGKVLFRWLCGRLLAMLITGVGTGVGLWFLGVPLAGTVGAITALLTFIPNIGAAIALLLATLMALSQGVSTVFWVIGLYCLLQLIESNVLTPLIQQHQTSIPPALLIAFQLLMGVLTGFLGLTVATPLLAVLLVLVDETWYTEPDDVF